MTSTTTPTVWCLLDKDAVPSIGPFDTYEDAAGHDPYDERWTVAAVSHEEWMDAQEEWAVRHEMAKRTHLPVKDPRVLARTVLRDAHRTVRVVTEYQSSPVSGDSWFTMACGDEQFCDYEFEVVSEDRGAAELAHRAMVAKAAALLNDPTIYEES